MKKLLRNVLTFAISGVLLLGTTACGPVGTVVETGDSSKTELRVYSYDGGVGNAWLDKVIERFERDFAEYEFEPGSGKVGVKVVPNKTKVGADLSTIQNSSDDVFFSEWIDIPSLIAQNKVLDIHDAVTTPLNEFLEGRTVDTDSIENKMYPTSQKFFSHKVVNGENRYYGLPHYSHFPALIYNKAYFDSNKLYFANEPVADIDYGEFISADNPVKSCGPDGILGNADDGLPATWDEMFKLMDYIVEKGHKPFIWGGEGAPNNTKQLMTCAYLNLAGKTVADYNYSFDSMGERVQIVTGFDINGEPVLGSAEISPLEYSALNKLLYKWQTFELFDRIIDERAYLHDYCVDTTAGAYSAQKEYIFSVQDGKPAAMLLEGSYWYNEAYDWGYFDEARAENAEFDMLNDFRLMPLPRVYNGESADVLGRDLHNSVVTDQADSFACINAKIQDKPNIVKLAKMFVAYCYTSESLAEFTETTNTVRYFKYDCDTTKLSDYGKSVWEYVKSSDLVLPYSDQPAYLNNKKAFSLHVEAKFWDNGSGAPWTVMRGAGESKSAISYFTKYMSKSI